jgi:hypothetical protein
VRNYDRLVWLLTHDEAEPPPWWLRPVPIPKPVAKSPPPSPRDDLQVEGRRVRGLTQIAGQIDDIAFFDLSSIDETASESRQYAPPLTFGDLLSTMESVRSQRLRPQTLIMSPDAYRDLVSYMQENPPHSSSGPGNDWPGLQVRMDQNLARGTVLLTASERGRSEDER